MSKLTRITVLCPNGRKQAVNLKPNSSFLQILEEVCQKQNVNPDDFDICHHNKPLDLSLPVRFANLSNNAQLELQPAKTARKDCLVTVALQLEAGERIMKDFMPSVTLWDVVEQCLNNKLDKTSSSEKCEPVCVYMRQTLIGDALKTTTLRGLGLTKGSAIIRFMLRNPEDISGQAHVSTPLSKPSKVISPEVSSDKMLANTNEMECDPPIVKPTVVPVPTNVKVSVISSNEPVFTQQSSIEENKSKQINSEAEEKVEEITSVKDIPKSKNEIPEKMSEALNKASEEQSQMLIEQNMELDSNAMDQDPSEVEIGAIHYIGGRRAVLYSLDDISDVKKADLPDEFFELTIDDAKYLMEEFKKSRVNLENQPLLTKELRNRKFLQKLGRFKQTVIRVYFPERLVLQAIFEAQETVQDVCNFIREFLEIKDLNFYLYTTPPKEKKDPSKTLIESMLIPAAVMYFGCNDQRQSYLSSTLKDKVSDPRAASLAAYESRKEAISEIEDTFDDLEEMPSSSIETAVDDKAPGPSVALPSRSVQTSDHVPKWLKMSKK